MQKGDWAAQILRDIGLLPLFGQGQAVSKLILVNPNCAANGCNNLKPGDVLLFPEEYNAKIKMVFKVLPSGEVIKEPPQILEIKPLEPEFTPRSQVVALFGLRAIDFKGQDRVGNTSADFPSFFNPTLFLNYERQTSKKIGYRFDGSIMHLSIKKNEDAVIQDREHWLGEIGASGQMYFEHLLSASLSLSLAERLLFDGYSTTVANIDKSTVPEVGFHIFKKINYDSWSLSGGLGYRYFLKTSLRGAESNDGFGYDALINIHSPYLQEKLIFKIGYSYHEINFDNLDVEYNDYYGAFGYLF